MRSAEDHVPEPLTLLAGEYNRNGLEWGLKLEKALVLKELGKNIEKSVEIDQVSLKTSFEALSFEKVTDWSFGNVS